MLVACHVPNGVDAALQIGLDVETWLKNDLVDILIGGWGYIPLAMAPHVREMSEFWTPAGCDGVYREKVRLSECS